MKTELVEESLELLNSHVSALRCDVEPLVEAHPVFVVGPPRSGTTLMSQMLVSNARVAYTSNIAACIWENMPYGALLHRISAGDERLQSDFKSSGGRTSGPTEPHEAGRFWLDQFGQGVLSLDDMDRNPNFTGSQLGAILAQVQAVWGFEHFVAKSFLAPSYHRELLAAMPSAHFVVMQRSGPSIEQSLLNLRKERGIGQGWLGLRPNGWREVATTNPESQVQNQVALLLDQIDSLCSGIPDAHRTVVSLDEFLNDPLETLRLLQEAVDIDWLDSPHLPAKRT